MGSPPGSHLHSHANAKHPSMMSTNAFGNLHQPMTKDASAAGEPSRRKTATEQEVHKPNIQRRKSIPTNNSDNDYHRRKLFDSIPNGNAFKTTNGNAFKTTNSNAFKTTQNGPLL